MPYRRNCLLILDFPLAAPRAHERREPKRRFDIGGQQIQIKATRIVGIEGGEAEALPPGTRTLVQRGYDHRTQRGLSIEFHGCRQDVGEQRGPDAQAAELAIHSQPTDKKSWHRVGSISGEDVGGC